jgi:hypothetical protein
VIRRSYEAPKISLTAGELGMAQCVDGCRGPCAARHDSGKLIKVESWAQVA